MTKVTKSVEGTHQLAKDFLNFLTNDYQLSTNDSPKSATVVALFGDLGSGKTTFVQGLARSLGIKENITSPTFVIEKIYPVRGEDALRALAASNGAGKLKHFIHIDAYRLESAEELEKLGWPELVADPGNLIVIEWADRVQKILPADSIRVNFKFTDENKREISWNLGD